MRRILFLMDVFFSDMIVELKIQIRNKGGFCVKKSSVSLARLLHFKVVNV